MSNTPSSEYVSPFSLKVDAISVAAFKMKLMIEMAVMEETSRI